MERQIERKSLSLNAAEPSTSKEVSVGYTDLNTSTQMIKSDIEKTSDSVQQSVGVSGSYHLIHKQSSSRQADLAASCGIERGMEDPPKILIFGDEYARSFREELYILQQERPLDTWHFPFEWAGVLLRAL
ncbi:unnamed protein product [Acanthoscelides obtectus]|uniref:Uncharacterized protein n=1 Tax=Acanthoscelides obtectus TaxID=200917 RepID=A0A9P0LU10_ACAOB|nr:unnamed protein product [Acanthoscelides obtectus]CAK1643797.1 hypothetical protein AOBTE_LOCUS13678 [Acanthoscelides obtectus]